jgi:hypothetical protein
MTRVAYAPDLVEEAVLLAEPAMPAAERRAFRRERDPLYEIADGDLRDERFCALHLRWFARLDLPGAIEDAIAEGLGDEVRVGEARVLRARSARDEGADLVDVVAIGGAAAAPVLVVRVRPALLLDPAGVRALLRHELMHVRDMLDPAFGYERTLPSTTDVPSETILRDRFRVLWDVTIDGRLARASLVDPRVEAARRREFEATFPMLGSGARDAFDAWFERDRPTHDDLLAFARAPTLVIREAAHGDARHSD